MIPINSKKVPIIVISHSIPITDSRFKEDNEWRSNKPIMIEYYFEWIHYLLY